MVRRGMVPPRHENEGETGRRARAWFAKMASGGGKCLTALGICGRTGMGGRRAPSYARSFRRR